MAMLGRVVLIFLASIAAIPNTTSTDGVLNQCSTPSVVLKFKDLPRCGDGSVCVSHSDCSSGSCIASPVDPTTINVDVYSGGTKVVSNMPAASTNGKASMILPRVATKLSPSNVSMGKNKLVVKWTTVCASNQAPCSTDANCPGSVCLKNSEEIIMSIKKVSGESC